MCGIAGFTHYKRTTNGAIIRRIAASLAHRGPDQQGFFESSDISLGAVRLKVIDPNNGDQPLTSEDGDTVIVFNGEIYNHCALRRELESLGYKFRTKCDTEVLLAGFREWDTECFSKFRGMFAVALWSESQRRLVLARDRLGIKPLYYGVRGDNLYFGSELKALLAHPEIGRNIDLPALSSFLSLNYVPGPSTLVEGIRKLPPGHWLEWRHGAVTMQPWWQIRMQPRAWNKKEALEELGERLRTAVSENLVSDVPVGVWLSGGLDSSTVLHFAATQSSARLKTFSVSFNGRRFDESRSFREIAKCYGTDHYELDVNENLDLAGAFEKIVWHSDEPGADAGGLPMWFLAQMTSQHATVALSGEGMDELMAGYATYRADAYAATMRRVPLALRRTMLWAARRLPVSNEKIGFEYKLKRFLSGSLLPPVEAHFHWNGSFEWQPKLALRGAEWCGDVPNLGAQLGVPKICRPSLNDWLALDQKYYLPDNILAKCDRMSMAHSVEVRPPLLDHRLVEFIASLPPEMKLCGARTKVLLRDLMKTKLPRSILRKPKEGFDIPVHEWLRGTLKPLLLDVLSRRNVERCGIFRWKAVHHLLRQHLEGHQNLGYSLWGLMTVTHWMNIYKIEVSAGVRFAKDRSSSESAA
jgi:asparagine synthase (glutamine-hydrolysing)